MPPDIKQPRRRAPREPLGAAFVVLVALVCSAPSRAYAEPTAAERASARELYFRGSESRRAGNLDAAHRDFQAADAIMGVPTTALKLAEVEIELGLLVEAHESLERALRYKAGGAAPLSEAFVRAQASARELRDRTRARLASLSVAVTGDAGPPASASEPEHATVVVDGRTIARAARALPFFANPGHHLVELVVDGRPVHKREITLAEGEAATVTLAAPAPVPSAIAENGSRANGAAWSMVPALPRERSRLGHPLVVGGGIVTGVGVVVGSVAGALTLVRAGEARDRCPDNVCPPSQFSTLDGGQTYATVSTTSFVVAFVGAAVAVGTYLLAPRRATPPATGTRVHPPVLGQIVF